jgi:hypothetical protein
MNKVQEALKAAIEAMNTCDLETGSWSVVDIALATHACKSALSEIEKCEPVSYLKFIARQWLVSPEIGMDGFQGFEVCDKGEKGDDGSDAFAVYTSPISKECEPINEVYAFEKWLKENTLIRASLNIDLDYADPLAEIAYRAWKARAKLNAEKG